MYLVPSAHSQNLLINTKEIKLGVHIMEVSVLLHFRYGSISRHGRLAIISTLDYSLNCMTQGPATN